MEAIIYSPNSLTPIIRSASINHVSHSAISVAVRAPYSVYKGIHCLILYANDAFHRCQPICSRRYIDNHLGLPIIIIIKHFTISYWFSLDGNIWSELWLLHRSANLPPKHMAFTWSSATFAQRCESECVIVCARSARTQVTPLEHDGHNMNMWRNVKSEQTVTDDRGCKTTASRHRHQDAIPCK